MPNEEIHIVIDAQGNPTIRVAGVAGPGCKELTRGIEAALGKVVQDTHTAEFLQQPTNQQNHLQAGF